MIIKNEPSRLRRLQPVPPLIYFFNRFINSRIKFASLSEISLSASITSTCSIGLLFSSAKNFVIQSLDKTTIVIGRKTISGSSCYIKTMFFKQWLCDISIAETPLSHINKLVRSEELGNVRIITTVAIALYWG